MEPVHVNVTTPALTRGFLLNITCSILSNNATFNLQQLTNAANTGKVPLCEVIMSQFPIVHEHYDDVAAAERHLFTLVNGGWAAKLVRPAGKGWQVIVNGFRGFTSAPGKSA